MQNLFERNSPDVSAVCMLVCTEKADVLQSLFLDINPKDIEFLEILNNSVNFIRN